MPKPKQPKDGAAPTVKAKAKPKPKAKRKPKAKPKPAPKPVGRPSKYSQELGDRICAQLASGMSLRTVCRAEDMPSTVTVFSWFRIHEEFLSQYARAKEESADALYEEVQDIADDGTNDWMEKHDAEGNCTGWALNGEHVQRSRLRVDTRKWMMAKMKPKKYGDRIQADVTGTFSVEDYVLAKARATPDNG